MPSASVGPQGLSATTANSNKETLSAWKRVALGAPGGAYRTVQCLGDSTTDRCMPDTRMQGSMLLSKLVVSIKHLDLCEGA